MNMIVNKSDLVGYEAVNSTKARKEALAKIVAAWESKQAKNAARFGGLGFLAISLAACNSSSDDTTTTTTTTPTTTTPTVTALSSALETTADVITSTFTTADDNITATQATLGAGDVLVDTSSTDNDTLTVTMSTATATAPSTITGIENVIYNYTGITAGATTIDAANIIGANITVNHTGNAAVVDNGSTVNNIGANNTVTFGTSVTGQATAAVAASATGVTINGGSGGTTAGDFQVNTGASVDGLTIAGGAAGAVDVNLGATNKNVTITGGSTAGTMNVDVNSATGVAMTTGAADTALSVTNIASSTSITYSKAGTTTSKGSISIDGTAATTDTASITAAGVMTLETINGGEQVEVLSLSGNGAAATYELDGTGDQPTTVTFTGGQSVTLTMNETQAATLTTMTDSTTAGTTTTKIGAVTASRDLKAITSDVIDVSGAITASSVITVKDGSTVNLSTVAQANAFEVDVDDGATTNTTAGSLTLNVSQDLTTVNVDTDNDVIATLNVVNSGSTNAAPHTYAIVDDTATEDLVINTSGTAVTFAATTEAKHLNGAGMTGTLTATVDADLLQITGGSGDDTITGIVTVKGVIDGGSGNDTFVTAVGDMSNTTLTGIEVIDITAGNAAFKASALSGQSYIIKNDDATDQLQINAAALVDISTIDLSTLSFNNDALVTVTLTNFDTSKLLTGQSFNVTGTTQADTITGSANADTLDGAAGNDTLNGAAGNDDIKGGAGNDTIDGGAGNDTIDGGAGDDPITLGTGNDTVTGGAGGDDFIIVAADNTANTTAALLAANHDTITDFGSGTIAAGGDEIDWDDGGTAATVASATAAATGTAQIATAGKLATFAAADDTLAEKITAVEAAIQLGATQADGQAAIFTDSGNTYVFISEGTDGIGAGDALISLGTFDASSLTLTVDGGDFTFV